MALNNLVKIVSRPAKRLGRGLASGKGKTAGRGTKGQKSRSGYNIPRRFQGGQTSIIQRLPKVRGFKSRFAKPLMINLAKIEARFNDGEEVSFKTLIEKGLIKNDTQPVKVIGATVFTKQLKFRDIVFSQRLAKAYQSKIAEPKVEADAKPVRKKTAKTVTAQK